MGIALTRRQILNAAGLTFATGTLPVASPLLAQSLPGRLRREVALPASLNDIVRTIEAIAAMERDARNLRLPPSSLPTIVRAGVPVDQASLYRAALPRLVALIDRAEPVQPSLADRAAALLARLHGGQHQIPSAWRTGDGVGEGALSLGDLGPPDLEVSVAAPTIDLPEAGPAYLPPLSPPTTVRSRDFAALREEYGRLFAACRVLPDRRDEVDWCLALLRTARPRYEHVAQSTGVPWYFIAAIHGLEASFNFRAHLHNGDFPLTARTRQVPAGRPTVWLPPSTWEASATDALRLMGFSGQQDWRLERTLYRLEAYNGFGYRGRGVPSPYLWSFSDQYDRGKFVADGRWNPMARSQQCGAAVLIKAAAEAGDIDLP